MTPARYTYTSMEAGARYMVVLQAFRSFLFGSLGRPFSMAVVEDIRNQATDIARSYLNTEDYLIDQEMRTTALEAVRSANIDLGASSVAPTLSDAQDAFIAQSAQHLKNEIRAQLTRDIEAVISRYREFAVEAALAGFTGNSAAILSATSDRSERLKFYFRDRGGRLTPSQKFIKTVWRLASVTLAAEFYLLEATSMGATRATVLTEDPKSYWSEYEIDLTQPHSFMEVRDEIFHPQTNTVLKASL